MGLPGLVSNRVLYDMKNTLNTYYDCRGVIETAKRLGRTVSWSAVAIATSGTNVHSVPLTGSAQQYFRARLLQ
jgi:hypothetical protein